MRPYQQPRRNEPAVSLRLEHTLRDFEPAGIQLATLFGNVSHVARDLDIIRVVSELFRGTLQLLRFPFKVRDGDSQNFQQLSGFMHWVCSSVSCDGDVNGLEVRATVQVYWTKAVPQAWVGPDRCCDESFGRFHGGNQVFTLCQSRRYSG